MSLLSRLKEQLKMEPFPNYDAGLLPIHDAGLLLSGLGMGILLFSPTFEQRVLSYVLFFLGLSLLVIEVVILYINAKNPAVIEVKKGVGQ